MSNTLNIFETFDLIRQNKMTKTQYKILLEKFRQEWYENGFYDGREVSMNYTKSAS